MEEGLLREIEDPAAAAAARSILGSEGFVDWVKRQFVLGRRGHLDDLPETRAGSITLEDVVAAVGSVTGVRPHILRSRRCRNRGSRALLMAVARRYCRGSMPQSAMARELGLSLGGFIQASGRGSDTRRPALAAQWTRVTAELSRQA